MCPRNIQGGIVNPWLKETEITIDQFKQWFPKSFIRQLDRLYMCGNLGDAIIAKDTLKVFQYLREVNPNIRLALHTNGSAQTQEWWINLANIQVQVTFGIDGLSDTHSLYRIGTSFEKIIKNAQTFIQAGGVAKWHMLVFAHNQHQVLDCEKLSKEMGFIEFAQKNSSRFRGDFLTVLTKEGKTSHIIYPSEKSVNISKKVSVTNIEDKTQISCKAKNESSLYVGADGSVAPCCWLDYSGIMPNVSSLINYKDIGFKNLNLNNHSFQEIFENNYFNEIEKTWENIPLKECNRQCGYFDKLNEQFK
jgi:hypothetical protein